MKSLFDIAVVGLLVWFLVGKMTPDKLPDEVVRAAADSSTELENMRAVAGQEQQEQDKLAAQVESLKQEVTESARISTVDESNAKQDRTIAELQKKLEGLQTQFDLLPKECPAPKIPDEIYQRLEKLEKGDPAVNEQLRKTLDELKSMDKSQDRRVQRTPQNKVQALIAYARDEQKNILFYYTQDVCPWCPQFERDVWNSRYVRNSLDKDCLFYTINKDHLKPGEDFSVPPAVPAVQLLLVSDSGVHNSTVPIPLSERTPERFVALVRAKLERKM